MKYLSNSLKDEKSKELLVFIFSNIILLEVPLLKGFYVNNNSISLPSCIDLIKVLLICLDTL